MISYRPLLIYCLDHHIKLTNLIRDCELSKNIVTRINNNQNIEIRALERICLHLNIAIQDAVEFIKD